MLLLGQTSIYLFWKIEIKTCQLFDHFALCQTPLNQTVKMCHTKSSPLLFIEVYESHCKYFDDLLSEIMAKSI